MRLGLAFASLLWPAFAHACTPVDWLTTPLPSGGNPIEVALETAYPGLDVDRGAGVATFADGAQAAYFGPTRQPPLRRLQNATIGDQFAYRYPLDFDLESRKTPWVDPGRLRNDAFFRALWFGDESSARESLVEVRFYGRGFHTPFQVSTKHCVHVQLAAALDEIMAPAAFDAFLRNSGGSFNWRVISGTERLSAHSFGIAVDFNTELGGYWRWSGAAPGAAHTYNNKFPPELVAAMERRGFIWGGKWHHFDGMHFEYRPELILYSRLIGGS